MIDRGTAVLFVTLLATGQLAGQSSWPRFRGPNGSGVATTAQSLPISFAGGPAWQTEVSAGHSSPIVWGERLFITGHRDHELETLCLDRRTGAVLWRKGVAVEKLERVHRVNSQASPTPVTDGKRVYVSFGSFGLLCYDMDGTEVWRRPLARQPRNTFGTASSLVLVKDHLIFVCENQDESFIEALDPATGAVTWHKDRKGFQSGWSTPTYRHEAGSEELLVYSVFWLTAMDLKDGSDRWAVPGLADEPTVTPILGEGLVYVSSYNMKTNTEVIGLPTYADLLADYDGDGDGLISYAEGEANQSVLSRYDADGEGDHPLRIFYRMMDEDQNKLISEPEYQKLRDWVGGFSHENGLVAIRPPGAAGGQAEVVWRHGVGIPEIPSPLYAQGRIYLIKNGGILTCLDAKTGAVKYKTRLSAGGPYYASPIAGDGKLYAASTRGVITVIELGDEGKILGKGELGERIMATPAIAEDKLYIRTQTKMMAFAGD